MGFMQKSGQKSGESGNIFFAIFGAVALLGILAAGTMTFIKGPLATSVKLNRQNVAENQMMIGGQVAVMSAAAQSNSGDCDSDAFVEPLEWRDPAALPAPTGGGLVPGSVGIAKKDPWGTEYGYCGWDHGPQINGGGTCGGATQKRLSGSNTNSVPVVALISAGPDKVFSTTCRTFAAADVNSDGDLLDATDLTLVSKAALTDDDVIFSYTYQEATAASGGLWSLKSGDAGTAVIDKNIETTGTANMQGGIMLADKALITCDPTTAGVMAMNGNAIEICDGAGTWTAITGGGGFGTTAVCVAPSDAGNIRYNTGTGQPEFCNGTMWVPFTLSSLVANLVFTPTQNNSMNVDGTNNLDTTTCIPASGFACGAEQVFTLQNQGGAVSASISVALSNTANFVKTADTCNGNTLAINASCTISIRPRANGNLYYSGNIQITANNNPFATMQGTSTNFGCYPGRLGGGGYYTACGISDPDGTYDLVIMPGGCNGGVTNPACGDNNTIDTAGTNRPYGAQGQYLPNISRWNNLVWGARQHQNLMAISSMTGVVLPAAQYCDDMIYGGYNDWYLPSYREWEYVRIAAGTGNLTFAGYAYKLSDLGNYYEEQNVEWVGGGGPYYRNEQRANAQQVRCIRRDNLPLPTATPDIDPDNVGLSPFIAFTPSAVATSNTVSISGIMQPITVSISGGTGMDIIKNGTPTGLTTVPGIKSSDTLAFRMNGPAVLGTKTTATVTIGSDTISWWAGYADSTKIVRAFVATGTAGNKSGIGGADAACNAAAIASPLGLPGAWKAILSTSSLNAVDRIPWNWGTMKAVTGTTIVDGGIADLFDGSVDSAPNIKADGTIYTGYVHTGSSIYGTAYNERGSVASYFCNDWSNSAYYSVGAAVGNPSSLTQAIYFGSGDAYWCSGDAYVANPSVQGNYCIEDIDSASDDIPAQMFPAYKIQVATSGRIASDPVAVSGMSAGATQTLSVSAPSGTPTFTINGGSEVSSGTVQNGDILVFRLTAPATASTSLKMTMTASTMTSYWRIWTGDPTGSAVKRAFVTNATYNGNLGGLAGGDAKCQSQAATAGLGGTWKALLSDPADENNWAINRIGYNWSTLEMVDGTDVATAGQIWNGTLLSPLNKNQSGAVLSSTNTYSNTTANGKPYSTNPASACGSWTTGNNDYDQTWGVVGATTSQWVAGGNVTGCYPCSDGCYRLTCIEQ